MILSSQSDFWFIMLAPFAILFCCITPCMLTPFRLRYGRRNWPLAPVYLASSIVGILVGLVIWGVAGSYSLIGKILAIASGILLFFSIMAMAAGKKKGKVHLHEGKPIEEEAVPPWALETPPPMLSSRMKRYMLFVSNESREFIRGYEAAGWQVKNRETGRVMRAGIRYMRDVGINLPKVKIVTEALASSMINRHARSIGGIKHTVPLIYGLIAYFARRFAEGMPEDEPKPTAESLFTEEESLIREYLEIHPRYSLGLDIDCKEGKYWWPALRLMSPRDLAAVLGEAKKVTIFSYRRASTRPARSDDGAIPGMLNF